MRRVIRKTSSLVSGNENDQPVAPDEIAAAFRRYAVASARASDQKDVAEIERAVLLAHAEVHGEKDAKGHRHVDLEDSFTVPGGKTLSGFTREKRTSERLNLERAKAFAEETGLTSRLFPMRSVEVFDEAELYAAYQEDLITDEELRALIDTTTTYALKVRE